MIPNTSWAVIFSLEFKYFADTRNTWTEEIRIDVDNYLNSKLGNGNAECLRTANDEIVEPRSCLQSNDRLDITNIMRVNLPSIV